VAGGVTPRAIRAVVATCVVVSTACERSQAERDIAQEPRTLERATGRVYHTSRWDTVQVLGGQVEDTTLLLPRLIAAAQRLLYVYDFAKHQLIAFDDSGAARWHFGRSGAGPGEFRNPIDLKAGPNGEAWILDGGLGRVTIIDSDGSARRTFLLSGLFISDIVPLRSMTLGTTISATDEFWVAFDDAGSVLRRGRLPVAALEHVPQLARQTQVAVAADGEGWAAIFPFGNVFLVYRNDEIQCDGILIEGEPFPDENVPVHAMPVWAVSAALSDSSLFVLARGRSDDALQILDEYSRIDCGYRRTLRLPRKFRQMSLRDSVFHFAYEDPAPTVIGLRIRGLE
jgi:hypothetical protein